VHGQAQPVARSPGATRGTTSERSSGSGRGTRSRPARAATRATASRPNSPLSADR
jgi:hypothetical protein